LESNKILIVRLLNTLQPHDTTPPLEPTIDKPTLSMVKCVLLFNKLVESIIPEAGMCTPLQRVLA
jgi:hypothetical protein